MNIEFGKFFRALWNREPFPWQTMLAQRVMERGWPAAIKLPTASGKTACIDIALLALAAHADLPLEKRSATRRIFFVVDRRIVIDEAFERAKKIAEALSNPGADGVLREIAERLRSLSGFGKDAPPLAVARLRGGVWRDDGWARMPTQPAIITSTVDQIGSRLLFRSYGGSDSVAPVHAALTANDSLILLDEAHCAQPFMQTLRAIEIFRGEKWAEDPLGLPFNFAVMSATPPEDIEQHEIFPQPDEADAALAHDILRKRINAGKSAELVECGESIASEAARCVRDCAEKFRRTRIAVMVNRVRTAAEIAAQLEHDFSEKAEIVMLTGRMRPFDRDELVARWIPFLRSDTPQTKEKPVIVVTTQCLEVGADFSFDALVTECASLDALRQRFGRLNRLGEEREVTAAILISKSDARSKERDAIYGDALKKTWAWLNTVAMQESGKNKARVDFGIAALDQRLKERPPVNFRELLAPVDDAPVLLPAHLDLFSQTSPRPDPDPDVSLFLHGKRGSPPEVSVLWRADLATLSPNDWADAVALLPPSAGEVFRVPLVRLAEWLRSGDETKQGDAGDVEGEDIPPDEENPRTSRRAFLLWRGADKSRVSLDLRDIAPGAVIILALDENVPIAIGQTLHNGVGPNCSDLAERVFFERTNKAALRVHPATLAPWKKTEAVRVLLGALEDIADDEDAAESFRDFAAALGSESSTDADAERVPGWLRELVKHLAQEERPRIEMHPGGGFVMITRRAIAGRKLVEEEDFFADESELLSSADEAVSLESHTTQVVAVAQKIVARCLPTFAPLFEQCARLHDIGKLDDRFQVVLQNGDELAAQRALQKREPLAKSQNVTLAPSRWRAIRESAGIPERFRHEMLSAQLAGALGLIDDSESRELALHLIECHHGFARPFAPLAPDENPCALDLAPLGITRVFSSEERLALRAAGRLDSGVAERFWKLTRRFGWWGIAYLEAMLRLADWHASRHARQEKSTSAFAGLAPRLAAATSVNRNDFLFTGIDGSNPLGYLAALGAFRLTTRLWPERHVLLGWEKVHGVWHPLLYIEPALADDEQSARGELTNALHKNGVQVDELFPADLLIASVGSGGEEDESRPVLRFDADGFTKFCRDAVRRASDENSREPEAAATWASQILHREKKPPFTAFPNRFDFTSGNQSFIGLVIKTKAECVLANVYECLFDSWRYTPSTSMRWDPLDEKRQYALMDVNPGNAKAKKVKPVVAALGANFLAIEALPLFAFVPNRHASQPGFDRGAEGRSWTWALWREPATLDVIRSLIVRASSAQNADTDREQLRVCARFRSAIVTPSGRYRCFTRPRPV